MKSEKGQALPLAMMTLAIGMIIITPFLGHASASVISSRTYGESINTRSACDAGIEHAIWRLTRDGLADQLSEPGDYIAYQLPEPINGLNTSVAVTANVSGSSRGDIGDSIIDSLEYDTATGYTPDFVRVSDSVFAIAYRGPGSDGFLKTVSVSSDGEIGNSVIDTLEFDTSNCYEPDIINVSGNIYAIAYRGPGSDGFLKTVSVSSDGEIGNSVIDTLEFDTSNCYEPDIINVSANIYAIAYRGPGNDGFLETVSINSDGNIGDSVVDTLEFDTSYCYTPCLIHASGDIFAIVYMGQSNVGFLKTVSIGADGIIGNSVIDTLEFDTSDCYEPCITDLSNDIYIIAYRGSNNDGFLSTVSIAADGEIGNSVLDTLEFDTSDGYEPCIIDVSERIYCIVYQGQSSDGFIMTVGINSEIVPTFEILSSAGGNSIRAYVRVSGENASIVKWLLE